MVLGLGNSVALRHSMHMWQLLLCYCPDGFVSPVLKSVSELPTLRDAVDVSYKQGLSLQWVRFRPSSVVCCCCCEKTDGKPTNQRGPGVRPAAAQIDTPRKYEVVCPSSLHLRKMKPQAAKSDVSRSPDVERHHLECCRSYLFENCFVASAGG